MQSLNSVFVVTLALLLTACAGPTPNPHYKIGKPYSVKGVKYYPQETYTLVEEGEASWYGPGFHGKLTANGEIYKQHDLTAAHRTLQLPSLARVTHLGNGRSVIVRVNDRGPFAKSRIVDVSKEAAEQLGFLRDGHARVRFEVLGAESMALRDAQKAGLETTGAEIEMNRTGRLNPKFAQFLPNSTASQPQTPQFAALETPYVQQASLPKPASIGMKPVMDDAVSAPQTVQPVPAGSLIFVQTESYASMDAARDVATNLSTYGPTSISKNGAGGAETYTVRVGPFSDMESATQIQQELLREGVAANPVVATN